MNEACEQIKENLFLLKSGCSLFPPLAKSGALKMKDNWDQDFDPYISKTMSRQPQKACLIAHALPIGNKSKWPYLPISGLNYMLQLPFHSFSCVRVCYGPWKSRFCDEGSDTKFFLYEHQRKHINVFSLSELQVKREQNAL